MVINARLVIAVLGAVILCQQEAENPNALECLERLKRVNRDRGTAPGNMPFPYPSFGGG
jgi:hypothetical protein